MADENHVDNPGANDETPDIPVPDHEVEGTPAPPPDVSDHDEVQGAPVPDDEPYGTPVPDDAVYGTPVPADEEVFGAPVEPQAPKVKRPAIPDWRGSSRWPLWAVIGCLLTCCLCCILPLCVLAVAGGGLAAAFKNSETSDTQTEQITIDPSQPLTLSVDGSNGSVEIRRGDTADEVGVTYTKTAHGWTKSAAEKELERITVDVQQPTVGTVAVKADTGNDENWFWSQTSEVDMTITIPQTAAITVNNDTGRIVVADVDARALDLHSNTGSITFEGSLAPDVTSALEIQTNTGSISVILPADTSARLDARTNTGSVSVSDSFTQMTDVNESQDGAGEAWTGTLGGSAANVPTLRLQTNTGSISVGVQ